MKPWLVTLLCTLACVNAWADDDLRPLKAWAPKGWRLIKQASGDLNGDGIKDAAVIFEDTDPANIKKNDRMGSEQLNTNPRKLIVLLGEQGLFKRVAESDSLVPPENTEVSPCLADPLSDLTINKGTLRLQLTEWLSCGGWSVTTTSYTYRFDGSGLRLIGEDESSFMRNSGEKSITSTNYLTGKRKITTGLNEFEKSRPQTTWENIGPQEPQYLN
ncbi:MAG: hypothetical protein ACOYNB_12010 [Aquabacterium sp.]|uniref:hypothetical protein n=1 Tax=Aquabacterium sp. TaxID=1872578 RepID=UPI003BD82B27